MPASALKNVDVDYNLPLVQIGTMLSKLVNTPTPESAEQAPDMLKRMKTEIHVSAQQYALDNGVLQLGESSNFTRPECGGKLLCVKEGNAIRFRCRTGHTYPADSLSEEITGAVETKL